MNCYQYKIVCQVKYEVLKLAQLQELLLANSIQPENFNLATFATECLQNADVHMNSYIQTCKGNVTGTGNF
ncbi:hypothetical protein L5515_005170 [Caenorhabditis briggsae]|uniref:Uncharacterized protein n=1 Tax=Caenorhabditis briggsae TaxID=6238 RepID=A0AAE9JC05_CAEBR|nr:hypothetical protein L5515_005170 [Caenorhabditis briggsae]